MMNKKWIFQNKKIYQKTNLMKILLYFSKINCIIVKKIKSKRNFKIKIEIKEIQKATKILTITSNLKTIEIKIKISKFKIIKIKSIIIN